MIYLDIVLKSLGIAALVTFMIIAIWAFVLFVHLCNQVKYTNYILEKISHIMNISFKEIDGRNDILKRKHHTEDATVTTEDSAETEKEAGADNLDENSNVVSFNQKSE